MTVLRTFLESLLNFVSNNLKKHKKNLVQSERKVVSKCELPETQFDRTVQNRLSNSLVVRK